jgi:hypothetical protein
MTNKSVAALLWAFILSLAALAPAFAQQSKYPFNDPTLP